VLCVAACASVDLAPVQIRATPGTASGRGLKRIVALPATCGTMQEPWPNVPNTPPRDEDKTKPNANYHYDHATALCSVESLAGVDQIVRSSLDFHGYEVIDAEGLNAISATRHEVVDRNETIVRVRHETGGRMIETRGALFEDATPREQAAILRELHADAVLVTRVWYGTGSGIGNRHDLIVQIRLATTPDRTLVWARRCVQEVGLIGDAIGLERATRCAAEGKP
jgi:hypothetical protein